MIGEEEKPPPELYFYCFAFTDSKSVASVIMGLAAPHITAKDIAEASESFDGKGFGLIAVSLLGCMTENEYRGIQPAQADDGGVEQEGGISDA
jgi:hypothetical protein